MHHFLIPCSGSEKPITGHSERRHCPCDEPNSVNKSAGLQNSNCGRRGGPNTGPAGSLLLLCFSAFHRVN